MKTRSSTRWASFIVATMATCFAASARADFVLKPSGQNAIPLRRKTLDVDATIRGGIASTTQTMTFANETQQRTEADFILTAPKGAIVTGFAYWYEKEKVVARIVEKERASQIYQHITSRMRDPALIEMIGQNTFRARIFPIMPNADLRVEIHLIQPLTSTRSGSNFNLELKPAKAGTGTLERLDVRVRVADSDAQKVVNSFNLPLLQKGSERTFTFSRINYRPDRDLGVALIKAPRAISVGATAARSGGSDGFFTLNLSARETLRRPRIAISGVKTYDVITPRIGRLRAFDSWIVSGRYRGQGVALVTVIGTNERGQQRRYTLKVPMTSRREDNNVATKLWASGRIAQLSASAKNRAAVVALSTRFTLPSKYTSWLAIPEAERVRYKAEKAQADFVTTSNALVREIAAGKGKSREAKELSARYESLQKQAPNSYDSLTTYLGAALDERYQKRIAMKYAKKSSRARTRSLQREINFLRTELKRRGASYQSRYERRNAYREGRIVADKIAQEIEANGENLRVIRLRARLQMLSRINGSTTMYQARQAIDTRLSEAANKFVAQKYAPRQNNARLRRLKAQLNRLSAVSTRTNAADALRNAERQHADYRIDVIANLLAEEVAAGRTQEKTHRVLDAELDVLMKRTQYKKTDQLNPQLSQKLRDLGQKAAAEKYKRNSDAVKVAELELRIARLKKALGSDSEEAKWIQRNALVDALQTERDNYLREIEKSKPNVRELAATEKHIARLYTNPDYVAPVDSYYGSNGNGQEKLPKDKPPFENAKFQSIRGVYERARQQSDNADLAPLNKAERERLVTEKAAAFDKLKYATKYFLRLGDPLISLDAPQNAQSVAAVMPDGSVKRLLWNATNRKWQARFDIPSHATPGEYSIALIVVLQSGQRIKTMMRYTVDMTAPEGVARAQIVTSSAINSPHSLRLELETGDQSARVVALLPWGERVELKPSTQNKNRFFALSASPAAWTKADGGDTKVASAVTYIITDKAHNRTTITVDMTK